MRSPVFGVSDLVRHKRGCTSTEDGKRLEFSDYGDRGVAKSKPLISCMVNHAADLRLFSHMQKAGFLMTRLNCIMYLSLNGR